MVGSRAGSSFLIIEMHTAKHQFLSIDGFEIVQELGDCGCCIETTYDPITGEEQFIRAYACSNCFDFLLTQLDQSTTRVRQQLTLGLDSPEGDRGRELQ